MAKELRGIPVIDLLLKFFFVQMKPFVKCH